MSYDDPRHARKARRGSHKSVWVICTRNFEFEYTAKRFEYKKIDLLRKGRCIGGDMKKKHLILVLILCIVMVFTSCGIGGPSETTQLPADTGNAKAEEITVDDSEVKLDTNIVSGDPAKIATLGENTDKSTKAAAEPTSVKTVSNSKTVSSEKETEAVLDAIFGNKDQGSQKADETNVSDGSAWENFDENGDPNKPYDEINPDVFEDEDVKYADNAILIKFKKSFQGKLTKELKKAGIGKLEFLFDGTDYAWYTGYILKKANLAETMENVRGMENVITAEYNFVSEATADTDDAVQVVLNNNPKSGEQWVLNSCGIQETWKTLEQNGISAGGDSGVVVAVIDTGVDYTHKDLKANMWVNSKETSNNGTDDDGNGYVDDYYGVDITAGKGSAMDDEGHGTHVAGIIAAANNKEGVVGIAYNTKIMAIKAGDASGFFLQNNVAKAVIYAYENGADVINMSFGGSESSIAVKDALETTYGRCVLVASAGNSGYPNEGTDHYPSGAPNYPAAYSFVLGVMSAGQDHTESVFSNWDSVLYNSVEYEVYAPGEQILSTLPGDRYAKLSGTSMAAPVVAAEAALLRSYYSDTSRYPTKYIYGQIAGGVDRNVKCANVERHTVGGKMHNVPGCVNFASALSDVPTPDLGISDYTLFDTQGFTADTDGLTAGCESVNNGDGILDAGETIALGFTLRNRWGMSKNTKVHIDADSSTAGIANPYVEFLNNDLDYGSIGTYSESDSGKLYTDDVWTGWQNPFYVKVSKDCPNEYSIRLNITVTCENGLDDKDEAVYTSIDTVLLTVRRGVELPNKIESDMTLTKDNYYIIPNATIIMEGATVTVEPGTKIQFWCSDPEDAYADTAIAYLKVEGNFICNGTEAEPIELFPSEWMRAYQVQIYENNKGYVELNYTEVTNPYLCQNGVAYSDYKWITMVKNCEFRQNNEGSAIYYRYLSNGKVSASYHSGVIAVETAQNCAFYKLGPKSNYGGYYDLYGNYEQCIFVDSAIEPQTDTSSYNYYQTNFKNCVFYGNHTYGETKSGVVSLLDPVKWTDTEVFNVADVYYDTENGKMYLTRGVYNYREHDFQTASEQYKITRAKINSKAELEFLFDHLAKTNYCGASDENGRPIIIDVNKRTVTEGGDLYNNMYLYEISAPFLKDVANIELDQYLVDIDLESDYQINAKVTPNKGELIYESENEEILTVDGNGLITPKKIGSTTVKIYAADHALYTYLTVNVRSVTLPEKIELTPDDLTIQVGETYETKVSITPRHATRYALSYESDNPEIASVDETGKITALATGDVKITAIGYGNIVDSITVHCILPAVGLNFKEAVYATDMQKDDGHEFYPEIYPAGTTDNLLNWESASPDICYVDENGDLIKRKEGIAVLKATIRGTEITGTIQIAITSQVIQAGIKKVHNYNTEYYALLTDGSLWSWGNNKKNIKRLDFAGVSQIQDFIYSKYSNSIYILDEKNCVKEYDISTGISKSAFKPLYDIRTLSEGSEGSDVSYYAVTSDGGIWSWGSNSNGQLGDGTTTGTNTPVQMDLELSAKKIVYHAVNSGSTWILCENGELYALGGSQKIKSPMRVMEKVLDIYPANRTLNDKIVVETEEKIYLTDIFNGSTLPETSGYQKKYTEEKYNGTYSAYIENGRVYIKGTNSYGQLGAGDSDAEESGYYQMQGVENATKLYFFKNNVFVELEDGSLYAAGKGTAYELGNGAAENSNVPVKLYFGLDALNIPVILDGWNHAETADEGNTEPDSRIFLDFNGAVSSSSKYGSISLKDSAGNVCMLTKKIDLDKLYITPRRALEKGETYTLTIPEGALQNYFQNQNAAITLTFTYDGPPELSDWNHTEEMLESSESEQAETINVVTNEILTLDYDVKIFEKSGLNQIVMKDSSGKTVAIEATIAGGKQLRICPTLPFTIGETYTLTVPAGTLVSRFDVPNEETVLTFIYKGALEKKQWNLTGSAALGMALYDDSLKLTYNGALSTGEAYDKISVTTVEKKTVTDSDGNETEVEETVPCSLDIQMDGKDLILTPTADGTFEEGRSYTLSVPENALKDVYGRGNANALTTTFVYHDRPAFVSWNQDAAAQGTLSEKTLCLTFDQALKAAVVKQEPQLCDANGETIGIETVVEERQIRISPKTPLLIGGEYTLIVPEGTCLNAAGAPNAELQISFRYNGGLECAGGNYAPEGNGSNVVADKQLSLKFNSAVTLSETESSKIRLQIKELTDIGETFTECDIQVIADGSSLTVTPTEDFAEDTDYVLTILAGVLTGENGKTNEEIKLEFGYQQKDASASTEEPETPTEPDPNEPPIPDDAAYDVVNPIVKDAEKMAERTYLTKEDIEADWTQYVEDGLNTKFKGNAILNRLIDDDVNKWMRITAPKSSSYQKISLGGNYWGTTSPVLINKQILDYDDYQDLADINEGKYLTEAPKDTWPFVVDAYIKVGDQEVDTVGNQDVTFAVDFNRDMDTTIPLNVAFGSSYPYNDYEVTGKYLTPTHWEGTIKLNTLIENGYQRWSISNGKAAGTSMKLYKDWGRFQFKIDTTAAQALIMQAEATKTGIKLSWSQDEFETLAGYNVYRATKEDGQYTKLNKSIIAADTKEWFDDTVIPGEKYYYNFTVVESDMTESEPSGKIAVRAFDTMAPNIYHSPVYHAFTGSKVMISATVTDNVAVDTVTLYYRTKGETDWKSKRMTNNNDKYSAAIGVQDVTTAGIEYYIDACDGNNHTYKGSAEEPYEITVQLAVDSSAKGDVDGNGIIEIKDAMMILMAANDRLNLKEEEFVRADLDGDEELSAAEALKVIQYVNGTITSIL